MGGPFLPLPRSPLPQTPTESQFRAFLASFPRKHSETVWLISGKSGTNGMAKNRISLDTNAVIFLTARGSMIPSGLENELNEADLFISAITEIELFSKPGLPPIEEESLRFFLSERIGIIDLIDDVKKETIALRRKTRLKLPDCIIAATSIVLDAVLLTSDDALLALSWSGFKAQNFR